MRPHNPIKDLISAGKPWSALISTFLGRPPSPLEAVIFNYRLGLKILKANSDKRRLEPFSEYLKEVKAILSQRVLDAIEDGNAAKIVEIAQAVDLVSRDHECSDARRAILLLIKRETELHGIKPTFPEVVALMRTTGDKIAETKSSDGNSQLRRLCAELGFQFAPCKKRQKPSANRKLKS